MFIAASGPAMTISIAMTIKVRGRSSATRTIHVIQKQLSTLAFR
jgi:hypothetical protein